jgi:GH35 family endo-1,4-beta-xylanase
LVREELIKKAQENGEELPKIELGFSNAENHYANGYGTQPTLEILKLLADKGWVDYVDVHFHIKKTSNLPSPQDVTETLKKYGQFINATTGQPIKVVVGEFDINISDIPTTDNLRFLKQAQIGHTYFNAILDAGVTDITFWGTSDYDSWYENGDLPTIEDHADALLFDDINQPKPLNYVFIQSLLKASQK